MSARLIQIFWPFSLGVDRGRHPRVGMAERGDRDPVREVEVRLAGGVVQAVPDAVAPAPLEVAPEDRREVAYPCGEIGQVGHGRDRFFHRPSV